MKTIYHIFTNNRDEWLEDYEEAKKLFKEWSKEFGCARLYEESWNNPKIDDEAKDETCLKSFGAWPC